MLVETFKEDSGSGLYNLKYHLLNRMVERIQSFGVLSAFTAAYMSISTCSSSRPLEQLCRGNKLE